MTGTRGRSLDNSRKAVATATGRPAQSDGGDRLGGEGREKVPEEEALTSAERFPGKLVMKGEKTKRSEGVTEGGRGEGV